MNENKLIFPSLDKSLNYREQLLRGWDAVEASIFALISTPMNSIPEMPEMGFDLHEFLFRDKSDSEIGSLEIELANKIAEVTGNSRVETAIEVNGANVYITITYQKDDGSEVKLPVTIEEGTNGRSIIFKNIIVR